MSRLRTRVRQLAVCYWLQTKILLISPFEGFLAVVFPLIFATAALMVLSLIHISEPTRPY